MGDTAIKKINLKSIFSGFSPAFFFAHFFNHLVTALPIPLLPFIRDEFNLSNTQAGFVITAFTLSMGLAQIPGGFLADRIGARLVIAVSIIGIGVSGLLIGLSQSYFLMLVFLVIMGVFGGGYHPSAPPLLASTVPKETLGKSLGFHLIGGNSAFFLAPLAGAGIASIWGWRAGFIGLAVPTIIFGILFYYIISHVIVRKQVAATVKNADTETKNIPSTPPRSGGTRQMVYFLILTALVGTLSTSLVSFIPLLTVDRFHVSAAAAAAYIALYNSSGLWASPIGGYLSDHMGHIPLLILSCIVAGPLIFLITITPLGAGFIIILLFWGALNSVRMPTTESYIIHNTDPKKRSTLFGIYYFATSHGNGILAPIIGFLLDHVGYTNGFNIVAAASLAAALLFGLLLWQSRTRTPVPES